MLSFCITPHGSDSPKKHDSWKHLLHHKSNVMILLQAQLFYFFLKISITAFIQNRNSIFACYFPIFIAREHIQMTISMGNAKASVVINTRFTRDSFLL